MKKKIMLATLVAFTSLCAMDLNEAKMQTIACDTKNDYKACAEASAFYFATDGVSQKQIMKAMSMAKKACDAKNATGCKILGELAWSLSEMKDIVKDIKVRRAKAYEGMNKYKKACDLGSSEACLNLSVMFLYEPGEFIAKDLAKSIKYSKKACDLDEGNGCNSLGNRYKEGEGVKQNKKTAFKYYEKACDLGVGTSCYQVGMLYDEGVMSNANPLPMFQAFEQACELKSARGCMMLGTFYSEGTRGSNKDEKKAQEAMKKACEYADSPEMKKMLCSLKP